MEVVVVVVVVDGGNGSSIIVLVDFQKDASSCCHLSSLNISLEPTKNSASDTT